MKILLPRYVLKKPLPIAAKNGNGGTYEVPVDTEFQLDKHSNYVNQKYKLVIDAQTVEHLIEQGYLIGVSIVLQ